MALYLLYQSVDEIIFERISSSKSTFEAWSNLYKTYRGEQKLRLNGENIEDRRIVEKNTKKPYKEIRSHELGMRQFDNTPFEQALHIQSKGKETEEKWGHIAKYCRKRIAEKKGSNLMHREDENDGDTLFMILSTQEEIINDIWYIDSGCSNHMTGKKDIFITLDES
ncbi:hypothetical protein LXL04_008874 [Taraxacum kok-saghyz]